MSRDYVIDMSAPKESAAFLNAMRRLKGKHRISVCQYRPRRTDRQNRYYWPCFVKPFGDFLRDQGEYVTDHEAHEMLKYRFLRESKVDHRTGETIEFVPSTTNLDTAQFNTYLDRCAHWLSDMFGIIVPGPEVYHEKIFREESKRRTPDRATARF